MKKVYAKPQIMFESFEISTNIASGCQFTNVTHGSNTYGCGYIVAGGRFNNIVVFTSEIGCITTEDDGEYNGICYHVPTDNSSLFTS